MKDFTNSGRPHRTGKARSARESIQTSVQDEDDRSPGYRNPPPPTLEQIREQHRLNALKVVDIYRQL